MYKYKKFFIDILITSSRRKLFIFLQQARVIFNYITVRIPDLKVLQ